MATAVSLLVWTIERESPLPYEALTILAVLLLNAALGFVQEGRAEQSLLALRRLSAAHAEVLRDGERRSVPAADLVPGDILLLEEGSTVPADARVFEAVGLQTVEAALTGESTPVTKDVAPIPMEVGARRSHEHGPERDPGELRPRPRGGHRHRRADRDRGRGRPAEPHARGADAARSGSWRRWGGSSAGSSSRSPSSWP